MRPLVLTMGEPSGIGPEIALAAHAALAGTGLVFAWIGDPAALDARARMVGCKTRIAEIDSLADAGRAFAAALPVLPLALAAQAVPGLPSSANAAAILAAIGRAVELALGGEAAGIVTNPVQKEALHRAGFVHRGHTEHLAALAVDAGYPARPVMMLMAHGLRTVPVTIHIPLKEVAAAITRDAIVEKTRIVARDLDRFFGIAHPRIAVTGLNPHAGEGGLLGSEEGEVIAPAVRELAAEGLDVVGPLPADTVFHEDARRRFEAIVCMYHDQALIPVKTIGFHDGVNCTLGLPFVRTSPDHGTALDLAGTGRANPSSLIAALRSANAMARQAAARAGGAT